MSTKNDMSVFRKSGLNNCVMISLASVSNRALVNLPMLTIVEYQRITTEYVIYTIICLKSVCLSVWRRSQTAGRNSCSIASGDVSN